jgi:hypothetical protein
MYGKRRASVIPLKGVSSTSERKSLLWFVVCGLNESVKREGQI